jgi:hypothetical protein
MNNQKSNRPGKHTPAGFKWGNVAFFILLGFLIGIGIITAVAGQI